MNGENLPLGVRIAMSNDRESVKQSESTNFLEFKKLMASANEILNNDDYIQLIKSNKKIRSDFRKLIIKAINILE